MIAELLEWYFTVFLFILLKFIFAGRPTTVVEALLFAIVLSTLVTVVYIPLWLCGVEWDLRYIR